MASVHKRMVGNPPRPSYHVHYRIDGVQKKKVFPKKKLADDFANTVETDKLRGTYIDSNAGKITLKAYGEQWLAAQTFEETTRQAVELRLRIHVYPVLGSKAINTIRPSTIQAWLKGLTIKSSSYRRVVFVNLSTILSAAVDDEILLKNPCKAPSVRVPKVESRKLVPWTGERVKAMHDALSERDRLVVIVGAGLGLRQGEAFGLSPTDIDWLRNVVCVRRQVRLFASNRQAFALPKGGKTREVPLPESVKLALSAYLVKFPAKDVELPWTTLDGELKTVPLFLSNRESRAMNRNYFNSKLWAPALAKAGVKEPTREDGTHALRHWYASNLLANGIGVREVSEYLGHADPGFTLRTYGHLTETSHERSRKALESAVGPLLTTESPSASEDAERSS